MTLHDKYSDLLLLVLLYKITIVNNLEMERSVLALLLLFQTGIYSASICCSSAYSNKNLMGIEENHDLTLVAAARVLGCFLGRVFGDWNSRGDLVVVLPSCARLSLQIRVRSAKNTNVSTKTVRPLFFI
jgi:hypothetical protein